MLSLSILVLIVVDVISEVSAHGGIDDGHSDGTNDVATATKLASGQGSPAIALSLTVFSGVSLCIGALLPLLPIIIKSRRTSNGAANATSAMSRKALGGSLGFASGIMIFGTLSSLFPSSVSSLKTSLGDPAYIIAILYAFLGKVILILIDLAVDWVKPKGTIVKEDIRCNEIIPEGTVCPCHMEDKTCCSPTIKTGTTEAKDPSLSEIPLDRNEAWQVVFAIALHKIPEGMATFLSSVNNLKFGIAIGFAMFVHSLPEGIMAIVPVYHILGSIWTSMLLVCLTAGFSPILGGLIGLAIYHGSDGSAVNKHFQGALFAVASGMLISIGLLSMLPAAVQIHRKSAIRFLAIGVIFIAIIFGCFEFIH